jgi:choline dehydrogenase-like flavoprotein
MKKAIVVGSGAGGAAVAKELQGAFEVIILEAGGAFKPFTVKMSLLEALKKTGTLFDEREIRFLMPAMQIRKTGEGMVLINGIGLGGTTTLTTGNALRHDTALKALGIDLDTEFQELSREVPISTNHQRTWGDVTKRLFGISCDMGLDPLPTPKMGESGHCVKCGRCVLGCAFGAKWDSRRFLDGALRNGAELVTRCTVKKVVIANGRATGVLAKKGLRERFYPADLVILAAGGLATPLILEQSGIACEKRLFVDPVLCVAAVRENSHQHREIPMPFVIQHDRFIVSPYFDYLSFFFNKAWKYPAKDIVSVMIKLADSNRGSVSHGKIDKTLTDEDRKNLSEGIELCTEMLNRLDGVTSPVFLGTLNAGHPGGMLPLTRAEAATLHHDCLPENLFVADATLFPESLGNPPMLTIMALAKRISTICKGMG